MGESFHGKGSMSLLNRSGTVVCSLKLYQGCAGTCGQYCCLRPCWCPWQHQWSVMPLEAMLVSLSHVATESNVDVHGLCHVHLPGPWWCLWSILLHEAMLMFIFYHHRPNRSPWTGLILEAMLISMVNVVNEVNQNCVYVHKLSCYLTSTAHVYNLCCHLKPYWFPWSGVPMETMWKNGVSSAAWGHVAIHGLCCCHGLWCLWPMFPLETMLVLPSTAIMMSPVCAVCTNHVQVHDTCCHLQWEQWLWTHI